MSVVIYKISNLFSHIALNGLGGGPLMIPSLIIPRYQMGLIISSREYGIAKNRKVYAPKNRSLSFVNSHQLLHSDILM